MADAYPNLGWNPCPGDVPEYQALADYTRRSAATLHEAVQFLGSAGSGEWRGQAADAFRAHVHTTVIPLAGKAADSVGQAAQALREWVLTLDSLQHEASLLDKRAAPYRADLAGIPGADAQGPAIPGLTGPAPKLTPAQQARVNDANTALSGISTQASDIHARYLAAVRKAAGQLQGAGHMAPHPPGLFSSFLHGIESGWDDFTHGLDELVHDKALWEFISSVANIIATVAGVLALIPPLSAVMAPIAMAAALVAMGADAVLAIFDKGSWVAVGLDAGAFVAGFGAAKSMGKMAEIYEEAKLTGAMTKAPTWAGAISKVPGVARLPTVGEAITGARQFEYVSPGMFRLIGASLREAAGDNSAMKELTPLFGLDKTAPWRAIAIKGGMLNWSLSAGAISAIPGTVHDWAAGLAQGKQPWQAAPGGAGG